MCQRKESKKERRKEGESEEEGRKMCIWETGKGINEGRRRK